MSLKKYKCVRQHDAADCGAASIAWILQAYFKSTYEFFLHKKNWRYFSNLALRPRKFPRGPDNTSDKLIKQFRKELFFKYGKIISTLNKIVHFVSLDKKIFNY